jgi:ATP-dependent Clp protease ATP-binding subunit ClpB
MDAGNMLKPALARGELHCVGATTLDEYRKYIEKDAALERRFQKVLVNEPTVEDTIAILRGCRSATSRITRSRSPTRPSWPRPRSSHRYIADRQLPDKAIDLIDEAGARIRMEIDSKPEALDRLERPHHPAQDRAGSAQERKGRGHEEAARSLQETLRGPREGIFRSRGDLEEREGVAARRGTVREELEKVKLDMESRVAKAI